MELYIFPVLVILSCTSCYLILPVQPLCHKDESIALLQFKDSLTANNSASRGPAAYTKMASWKAVENGTEADCCSWDGVKCDENTGHVISLDLSSSCLYGSIMSSSSLFSLTHLQMLNLADNHFNYSRIPPELGRLSKLTYLNLSSSFLTGLPSEISLLSNLSTFDLGYVNVSSKMPDFLVNLSSLTSLIMRNCGLYGEFPEKLFHLPKIQVLIFQVNSNLTGHFPEFRSGSPLRTLWFSRTNFSGIIPFSIGNLESLEFLSVARANSLQLLDLSNNLLSWITLPKCLENPNNLLSVLSIKNNSFHGTIPQMCLTDRSLLKMIDLGYNQLEGRIPRSLANCQMLESLNLGNNQIRDVFPSWLGQLSKLRLLTLRSNNLQGQLTNLNSTPQFPN
ncbi:hypothetical protein TIFTF001_001762 [Ficus carica]|uniref:Leucine-rich repeat-containing N-terminal plant-type domain-containing protein n=1 Tax=Ficus carica TaxID=3494 RepID=A0AA87Z318_FICCA|nr:hypothetical protein TIFTF001_001762 [Ficus carica]